MPIASMARSKPLRDGLSKIYGKNDAFDSLDDSELVEAAENLRRGVPIATPVFDGAREEDIARMLKRCGPEHLRPGHAL